jgi:hypothetical protein
MSRAEAADQFVGTHTSAASCSFVQLGYYFALAYLSSASTARIQASFRGIIFEWLMMVALKSQLRTHPILQLINDSDVARIIDLLLIKGASA